MTTLKTKSKLAGQLVEAGQAKQAVKSDSVLVQGDLSSMSEDQRAAYYLKVCDSLGLNPHTQPFEYIRLSGQLKLYATRACSDQLRKLHGVSITIHSRDLVEDTYTVVARAEDISGRTDESSGVVSVKGLTGEARANQLMKAETKAKRRVTLSICGLGFLDETEVESVQQAAPVKVVTARVQEAKCLPAPTPETQEKITTFRQACLACEDAFPGTMQRMLRHYQVDSADALVEAQMEEAKKMLIRKMEGKR